jgi:hypothetical protein
MIYKLAITIITTLQAISDFYLDENLACFLQKIIKHVYSG